MNRRIVKLSQRICSSLDEDRKSRVRNVEPSYVLTSVIDNFPEHIRKRVPYFGARKVRIYRSVPKSVKKIEPGDWVTLKKSYATQHSRVREGEAPKVLSKEVSASDVYWAGTDENEWFYIPGK